MVVVFNFRRWRYDRKIWLAFILNFIMCYFLTEKILQFSEKENTIMQIFEPFIWGFDDLEAIFFMTLLLLLYFADIPYLGNEVPFYLCRMTRKIWLAGQVVYIVCATAIYTVAILLSTILICGQRCYVGNIWSETAVISDTKYVKDKAAGIILELKPGAGEKVKEGRTVYLTVNTLDVPLRVIPDVADNSSLRQAQAKLLSAEFKLNEVQLVNGEKDWVYGVKYQGRQLTAGEKIPMGASLTLMVGDGAGDTVEEDSIDIDLDTEELVASESSSTQDDSWF